MRWARDGVSTAELTRAADSASFTCLASGPCSDWRTSSFWVRAVRYLAGTGRAGWIIPAGLMGMILAGLTTYALPDWAVFSSPFRQAYSCRFAGVARLCYFSVVIMAHCGRPADHGGALDILSPRPVVHSARLFVPVLHVLARCVPALQCRFRPLDQLAGLLHRSVHPLGGFRLRSGHAHSPPPVPGHPALPPGRAARDPEAGQRRLSVPRSSSATAPSATPSAG